MNNRSYFRVFFLLLWFGSHAIGNYAVALPIKFRGEVMQTDGGAFPGSTFSITLAGATIIFNGSPLCTGGNQNYWAWADVEPDTVYTGESTLIRGSTFCLTHIWVGEYPPCYETFLTGDYQDITDNPPAPPTYRTFTFELRSPSIPQTPLLSWTLQDGSGKEISKTPIGGAYILPA